ncbi:MAG: hypothetical protein OQJ96_08085 [Flavobacteriales bacterium]|nr:hypothetical protein [Flavobacteriales bacterium]MCW8912294.1 hypothetical protein [Flavobacteriales bacterium]MCW8937467.1 hypothetical protein [Flavobacteriales bacterium]MCW8968358.1 hypothetical protein [Flavobacteriales bacterium]MCW8991058.1 hypothetical protein [Flavobacteriales bacterium]
MKKLSSLNLLIFFTSLSLFFSCNNVEKKSILNEDFDSNTKGWIQEDTDFHKIEIKDGYYFIQSKDSAYGRTSTRSLDRSYLYSLPEKYSINTSIEIIQSDLDTAFCGLILESSSFEYEFRFFNTGKVTVEQYSYVTKKWATYDKVKSLESEKKVKKFDVEIKVDGWFFDLYVNKKKLVRGKMGAKNWDRLAPYAGKFTSIKVDYLRIN